jgi:hypothetical protein
MVRSALCLLMILLSSPSVAEQFSIKCDRDGGWYFITFDNVSNRAVVESPSGSAQRGHIISTTNDEILFDLLNVGQPKHDFVWNRRDGTCRRTNQLSGQPTFVLQCVAAELRPILSIYDRIAPYE